MKPNLTEVEITERLRRTSGKDIIDTSDGGTEWLEDENLHCAAVLIPLAWYQDEWHVILTRRSETVENHAGQVSFPGGGCDNGDTSREETALREAEEEIGLKPEDVRLLGRMNDMRTSSRYRVTPVVGIIPWPYPVQPAPGEVTRIFPIPLLWLADRSNWKETPYTPEGSKRTYQVIVYKVFDGEVLWGISGRMMVNLINILGL